jgi:hypothetical protein
MMFGLWRRGRGFTTAQLIVFSFVLIGLLAGLALLFSAPIRVEVPIPPQPIDGMPVPPAIEVPVPITVSGGLGIPEIVILVVVCIAIGAVLGAWIRSRSSAQKLKNEDVVVEKQKNRLESPVYAHTSDGDMLEVVDADESDKLGGKSK